METALLSNGNNIFVIGINGKLWVDVPAVVIIISSLVFRNWI